MSGWDDTPAPATGDGGFTADTIQIDSFADDTEDRGCPEPLQGGVNSGLCYNCNEPGHNKSDCPNPAVEREFTGECRGCGQTGHRKVDCPSKKPDKCKICKSEDHETSACDVNRLLAMMGITDEDNKTAEMAWEALKAADAAKETAAIKKAIFVYVKAVPTTTFVDLEQVFRGEKFNTYLIAKEQDVGITYTIVNLQGEPDQKFAVSLQWSQRPKRPIFAAGWPSTAEDNINRLTQAGFPVDGFVTICRNCGEPGHTKSSCEQEKVEFVQPGTVKRCVNCDEEGHIARDCQQPIKKRGGSGCRNCGSEDHIAKDCEEPPNMDNVECKLCSETGHFAKDCPTKEPETCRNCLEVGHRAKDCTSERVIICRNCDGRGHMSKECTAPRRPVDWSTVKCSNCSEFGHSYRRCPKPAAEEEGGDGGDGGW